MRVKIKKWGESAAIPIPAPIMAAAALHIDQEVDVREVDGRRTTVDPVLSPAVDLDDLLAGMTPDTFPEPEQSGPPIGHEFW